MNHDETLWRYFYIVLAAVAGAFTALGTSPWRKMTSGEIFFTLIIAFSFASFAGPWAAHELFRIAEDNDRAVAFWTYIFGSGANAILPVIIRKVKKMVGAGDSL